MTHFLIRRLVAMVPVVVVTTLLAFSLILLLPGDPARMMLGDQAGNAQAYQALRQELGLDKPVPVQYLEWLDRVAQGDFGTSLRDRLPISSELGAHVFPTVELAVLAMLVALGVALPTGIISALRPNSLADVVATLLAFSGVAVPYFLLGILLIYAFAIWVPVLPPSGYVAPWVDFGQNLRLMVLPALTLGAGLAAVLMRQIRSAMLEVLDQDYIVTARSKGLTERVVTLRHALRNALVPISTIIGLQVGALIGGAVITETIFSIPGMGRMIVDAIFFRDFPVVQAVVLLLALAVLVTSLMTDLVYAVVDPRIRFR